MRAEFHSGTANPGCVKAAAAAAADPAKPPTTLHETRIQPAAAPAPLPPKSAPNPDYCFPPKDAPAPGTARAHQILPDRLDTRSPHDSRDAPCAKERVASPPTDTAPPSTCPNRD